LPFANLLRSTAYLLSSLGCLVLQGLTHTSSLLCKFNPEDGSIDRDTAACKPSWYGDSTSFMGSGQTLQLPAAIRYKVSNCEEMWQTNALACKPSWYEDSTSFMGSGQTLQLPAAIRCKVGSKRLKRRNGAGQGV
jgi:hypothetical protein